MEACFQCLTIGGKRKWDASPTSSEFDSGSFTLWTLAANYARENGCGKYDFYDTPEHWQYVDAYAEFVKKYSVAIDLYSNVDVIPNAELTYRNQKYLEEEHGLTPVPVVHYTCDLDWLRTYMDEGYKVIALGGLVGSTTQDVCQDWIDRAFDIVCSQPSRLPKVCIHGFGVTSYSLLLRYPWWSVDSASWTKAGAFGAILVPHKRKGKFVFTEPPYPVKVSYDSPDRKKAGKHYLSMSKAEQAIVREWLELIQVPLGVMDQWGGIKEYGVLNRHCERKAANLLFFEMFRTHIPKYPWAFNGPRRQGFGLC